VALKDKKIETSKFKINGKNGADENKRKKRHKDDL
jgi:hypothetical protein